MRIFLVPKARMKFQISGGADLKTPPQKKSQDFRQNVRSWHKEPCDTWYYTTPMTAYTVAAAVVSHIAFGGRICSTLFQWNCWVCRSSTCSWKSSHYVGLLQWLTHRLTTECTAVQRAQEGSGATAPVVRRLVFSHGAIWQHRHIQLPVLQTVKNLQGGGGAQLQPETTPPSAFWSPRKNIWAT